MNGNAMIVLEEIAQRAGAVRKCEICGNYCVLAEDDEAERMAYGMATNAFKSGEIRGSLDDVRRAMKSVLDSANLRCPSCG